jgi:hypothetical protein
MPTTPALARSGAMLSPNVDSALTDPSFAQWKIAAVTVAKFG